MINLVLDYPKKYPIELTDNDKTSFDVNDTDQVKALISEALDIVKPGSPVKISSMIIECILEQEMPKGPEDKMPYRSFVLGYIERNFETAEENQMKFAKALAKVGK